jgi:hypothetical protein
MRANMSVPIVVLAACAATLPAVVHAPSASAAAKSSPFAGAYSGPVPVPASEWTPGWGDWTWPITVASDGRVSGSYDVKAQYGGYPDRKGTLSGSVDAAGTLAVHVRESRSAYDSIDGPSYPKATRSFRVSAKLAPLAGGGLTGTTSDGVTFTWTPR